MTPVMPMQVTIDGVIATIEILPDGALRVVHESQQVNPMYGPATAGAVSYVVHPIQRQQYAHLMSLVPDSARPAPVDEESNRPWWSYVAINKDRNRDKD